MSGTTPVTAAPEPVSPTAVKDTIDAYSGRFEFFKQTLTLGSAGLAGMAALFTDPTRVPVDLASKILVALSGASLLFIVAYAAMGISSYGNLLTSIGRRIGVISPIGKTGPKPPEVFARGVTAHGRVIVIALACAWLFLSMFALVKLWEPTYVGADVALSNMRAALNKATGLNDQAVPLDRLAIDGGDYVATYRAGADLLTVRATRADGKVSGILREQPTTPVSTKP